MSIRRILAAGNEAAKLRNIGMKAACHRGGTSLVVYPAAGLIDYFQGRHLVLINKTETKADARAELVIRDPIGKALEAAVAALDDGQ